MGVLKLFYYSVTHYAVIGLHTLALKGETFPQLSHMYFIFDITGEHTCLECTVDLPQVLQVYKLFVLTGEQTSANLVPTFKHH